MGTLIRAHTWQSPFQLAVLTLLAFSLWVFFWGWRKISLGIIIIIIAACSVLLTVWFALSGSRQEPGSGPLYFHLIVVTFYPHLLLPFLREPRTWGNRPVRGSRATTAASCHCHLIPRNQYHPAKAAGLSSNLPAPFPIFKLKAGRQGLMKIFCLGDIP